MIAALDRLLIQFGAHPWNPRGKYRLYYLLGRRGRMLEGVTPFGVRLRFRADDLTCFYFFRSNYETSLHALIAELPPGGVFIDVGANVGNYSVLAARRVGPSGLVVGFEPVARTYAHYTDHLRLNRVVNVVPYNAAVGATAGWTAMVTGDDSGLSYIGGKDNSAGGERCAVVVLDTLLPPLLGDREIDLMKIDVEGAELLVLGGADGLLRARRVRRLFVEIVPAFLARFGSSREELWAFLETRGYRPRYRRSDTDSYDEIFDRVEDGPRP